MKIKVGENRELILSEVYNGVGIETDAGTFAICMRDNGIELRLGDGPWYTWQDARGPTLLSVDRDSKVGLLETAETLIAILRERGVTEEWLEICNKADYLETLVRSQQLLDNCDSQQGQGENDDHQ